MKWWCDWDAREGSRWTTSSCRIQCRAGVLLRHIASNTYRMQYAQSHGFRYSARPQVCLCCVLFFFLFFFKVFCVMCWNSVANRVFRWPESGSAFGPRSGVDLYLVTMILNWSECNSAPLVTRTQDHAWHGGWRVPPFLFRCNPMLTKCTEAVKTNGMNIIFQFIVKSLYTNS